MPGVWEEGLKWRGQSEMRNGMFEHLGQIVKL